MASVQNQIINICKILIYSDLLRDKLLPGLLLLVLFQVSVSAQTVIRPQLGYGEFVTGDVNSKGKASHLGLRILLAASDIRSYGLEISQFEQANHNFKSVGIVLEQKLYGWFNMSIGTVGYFGFHNSNPVGLLTGLAWEPGDYGRVQPYISYRTDIVFADTTAIAQSLSLGLRFEL